MTRDKRIISGRVPTTVRTFIFFMSDPVAIGVRASAIEGLVGPKDDKHLIVTDIGDVMGPTRNRLNYLRLVTGGVELVKFVRYDVAKPEPRPSLYDQEFLGLAVMI